MSPSMHSQRSGYRSSSSPSATIGAVVAVHLVLGAAIISMTAFKAVIHDPGIIWTRNIPAERPKEEPKPKPLPKAQPDKPTQITTVAPTIDLPKPVGIDLVLPDQTFPSDNFVKGGPSVETKKIPEPAAPVFVAARPDPRYAGTFQPDYPAAMLRQQVEGKVTVRVMIGADGRVTDVMLVGAPDPAFFEVTRKQALARWRFTPATRDGVPVPSERVMTVTFRLTD